MNRRLALTSLCAASFALFITAAGSARANDPWFFRPGAVERMFVVMVGLLAAYSPLTWLVEAAVLNAFLEWDYWDCFRLAAAANIVSTVVGLIWFTGATQDGGAVAKGWKTAFVDAASGQVAILMLRSYIVTVAEETVVVALVARLRDIRTALKAVAAANAVSYALTFLALVIGRSIWP